MFSQFLPWYAEAIDAAQQTAVGFQNLVKSRRTVHKFDATEVDDGVLRRALECAIAAPNRRGTEVSETREISSTSYAQQFLSRTYIFTQYPIMNSRGVLLN